ncbi:hypothetical protein V1478_004366 [Vespula squamosa]|uniref:Uncharacterized protein n=1 Tax=Vespula squamosa TaxID=30214 RepID=A0ABD2BH71_VESSQ
MNPMQMNLGNLENSLTKSNRLGYPVKPDNYDRTSSGVLAHFKFVVKANCWNEPTKTIVLASCLRTVNDRVCTFLLDTGSNVYLVSPKLIDYLLKRNFLTKVRLHYPTEKVLLEEEKLAYFVELEEFSEKLFFANDCILECDFPLKTGLNE